MELNGVINYWDNHNYAILQLLMWMAFPRISFWFMSTITGGVWFWVGVFFVPRIMVAFWATAMYWNTNPVLCGLAWLIAVAGTRGETKTVVDKTSNLRIKKFSLKTR